MLVAEKYAERQHDIPTDELLDQLADHIGDDMFFVALELGMECAEIERLEKEEPTNQLKQHRHILKTWKENFDMLAKMGALAQALFHAQSDFWALYELVFGDR